MIAMWYGSSPSGVMKNICCTDFVVAAFQVINLTACAEHIEINISHD